MMQDLDEHYPTVDSDYLCSLIEQSNKVKDVIRVGNTKAYILNGQKPITKRTILVRETDDKCVDFYFATSIAIKLGLMGPLLTWLEEHKNWKDGAYIERAKP